MTGASALELGSEACSEWGEWDSACTAAFLPVSGALLASSYHGYLRHFFNTPCTLVLKRSDSTIKAACPPAEDYPSYPTTPPQGCFILCVPCLTEAYLSSGRPQRCLSSSSSLQATGRATGRYS